MNIKVKKALAKEFLIFLGIIGILFFEYVAIIGYNKINDHLSNSQNGEIALLQEEANKLSKTYDAKTKIQFDFIVIAWPKNTPLLLQATLKKQKFGSPFILEKYYPAEYDDNYKTYEDSGVSLKWGILTDMAKTNELDLEWQKNKKIKQAVSFFGINNVNDLEKFLTEFSYNNNNYVKKGKADSLLQSANLLQYKNDNYTNKIIQSDIRHEIMVNSFTILFILCFLIRYLVYSIQWSIKTSKN